MKRRDAQRPLILESLEKRCLLAGIDCESHTDSEPSRRIEQDSSRPAVVATASVTDHQSRRGDSLRSESDRQNHRGGNHQLDSRHGDRDRHSDRDRSRGNREDPSQPIDDLYRESHSYGFVSLATPLKTGGVSQAAASTPYQSSLQSNQAVQYVVVTIRFSVSPIVVEQARPSMSSGSGEPSSRNSMTSVDGSETVEADNDARDEVERPTDTSDRGQLTNEEVTESDRRSANQSAPVSSEEVFLVSIQSRAPSSPNETLVPSSTTNLSFSLSETWESGEGGWIDSASASLDPSAIGGQEGEDIVGSRWKLERGSIERLRQIAERATPDARGGGEPVTDAAVAAWFGRTQGFIDFGDVGELHAISQSDPGGPVAVELDAIMGLHRHVGLLASADEIDQQVDESLRDAILAALAEEPPTDSASDESVSPDLYSFAYPGVAIAAIAVSVAAHRRRLSAASIESEHLRTGWRRT